jgi:hypothetical protein
MPISIGLLRSPYPPVEEPQPVKVIVKKVFYTRRKKRHSKLVNEKNQTAWRHNCSSEPRRVYRSPIKPEHWVSANERRCLLEALIHAEFVFQNKWCTIPYIDHDIQDGALGWKKPSDQPRNFNRKATKVIWNAERKVWEPEFSYCLL